jgi:predicted RNase H-like nuclease
MARVAGVDGCRAGWVVATWPDSPSGPSAGAGGAGLACLEVEVVASFAPIAEAVRGGRLDLVAVDMPMGLHDQGRRTCDVEARRRLGPRRSSVFPTPRRAVLGCASYAEALAVSRAIDGVGLSKQAWFLVPKIRQLDELVRPLPPGRVLEVHPELAFAALTGAPMASPKRSPAGRREREVALGRVFAGIEQLAARRLAGAAPDDVLDACALAWSAGRLAAGRGESVGGELDSTGLVMSVSW